MTRAIKKASDAWHCEAKIFVFPKQVDLTYLVPFAAWGMWAELTGWRFF